MARVSVEEYFMVKESCSRFCLCRVDRAHSNKGVVVACELTGVTSNGTHHGGNALRRVVYYGQTLRGVKACDMALG